MKLLLALLYLCFTLTGLGQLREGLNHSTVNIMAPPDNFQTRAIIWLPPQYDSTKKYPLVIYAHGSNQAGEDLNNLYIDGLPSVLKAGFRPPFDCIIICPQRISYTVLPEWLPGIIDDAIKRFNIDQTRIYLTGTSAGGYMCYGSQLNVSIALSRKIAAICVISGATQDAKKENLDWWLRSKTHLWAIVGSEDQSYVHQNIFLINSLNQGSPGIANISIRTGIGHGNWEEVYNGTFKDNGLNIWQWFYQYKLGAPASTSASTQAQPAAAKKEGGKRILVNAKDKQVYCTNVTREYNPQPGDTLVIPTRIKSFLLRNFYGDKNKPIVIIPQDSGWIGGYDNYSANVAYARYFKITGFHIDGENATHLGLVVAQQTRDYEISNCFIKNTWAIGLCAKQDPDSTQAKGYWPGFSIKNVSIHDITVRNAGTEGFYLGYTFDIIKPLASPLINLQVYNIKIDSTGWDGLQLSNCHDVRLHDVVISNYGLKNQSGQQAGLLLGGMVTLRDSIYNVSVTNGTGAGLLIFGKGTMKFSRITLKNVGMTQGENAIYVNDYKDFGFNLPPLKLNMKNIKINGSSGHALIVVNGNKTMLPGKVENLTFTNTAGGIMDDVDQIIK